MVGHVSQLDGHAPQVAVDLEADHGHTAEPERERIGHRDDLHHPSVDHLLDTLADGRLGHPHRGGDAGVGPAAVLLELLDDGLGDIVEDHGRGRGHGTLPAVVAAFDLMQLSCTAPPGFCGQQRYSLSEGHTQWNRLRIAPKFCESPTIR